MTLLPELDALSIKRLNQGEASLDRLPTPDLGEILLATEPDGNSDGSGIYQVTNRLEVILNIHQWNKDRVVMTTHFLPQGVGQMQGVGREILDFFSWEAE